MPAADYQRHKAKAAAEARTASLEGRDIGPLPKVGNPKRKAKASRSFKRFCDSYLPETFKLKWSPDHLRVIERIETAVLEGGLFAMAMPRGSGKSSLCEAACLWATLYGHREFVCLIGSDEGHADGMLDSIRVELEGNDLLEEDFPEVCYPVRRLEGIANRCRGQLLDGERTRISWTSRELVYPTVPGSVASGAVIRTAGITGRIRGMKFKRPDGRSVRPSLVVVDDPQTDESARSPSQCASREAVLSGAILNLAGPGVKISGVMPCTVIRPGDMADRILDRSIHPEWHGERTKLVYAWPSNEALWRRYAELRSDDLREGGDGKPATEFYRRNRTEMDEGGRVAWPERHDPSELSAIQHAWNLRLRDEGAFFAEYQNEPTVSATVERAGLTPSALASRLNKLPRAEAAPNVVHLTAAVDVQQDLLYWLVCGWESDFTGYVIDYGAWPEQHRTHFTLKDARPTLTAVGPGGGLEAAIHAGLDAVAERTVGREWPGSAGPLRVGRMLIDANWAASTDTVYRWCRETPLAAVCGPAHGRYVGASSKPLTDATRKPGERIGLGWRHSPPKGRSVRYTAFDGNLWKSFVAERLALPPGARGGLTLFGEDAGTHRLLAEHLTAEYRVRTEGRGRVVDEWKLRPERPDNHWWDCLVMAAVAASFLGLAPLGSGEAAKAKPARKTYAQLRAERGMR